MRSTFVSALAIGILSSFLTPVWALAVVESRTGGTVARSSAPTSGVEERAAHLTLHQIEALKQEISELRGLVEMQEHTLQQLKKSQQDFYTDLDKRISQTSQNQKQTSSNPNSKDIQITNKTKKSAITIETKPIEIKSPAISSSASASVPGMLPPKLPQKESKKSDPKKETAKNESKIEPVKIEPAMDEPDEPLASEDVDVVPTEIVDPAVPTTEKKVSKTSSVTIMPTNTNKESIKSNEKNAYEVAYSLVRNKKYDDAITAFQNYLVQYPHGERSPSAHYWLGEVYMVQWQQDKSKPVLLDKASQAFLTITTQFPTHNKVPDALLKLGLIENEKGNLDAARRYLMDAKSNHPGTAAARIAETRLQQLK